MLLRERPYGLPIPSGHRMVGREPAAIAELFGCSRKRMHNPEKIELYNEGEYCEEAIGGKTCLDHYSNAPCNPCLRRIENINSY